MSSAKTLIDTDSEVVDVSENKDKQANSLVIDNDKNIGPSDESIDRAIVVILDENTDITENPELHRNVFSNLENNINNQIERENENMSNSKCTLSDEENCEVREGADTLNETDDTNERADANTLVKFSCPKCEKLFKSKRYANQHCVPKKPWICPKCLEEIAHSRNINRHIQNCSKPKAAKQLKVFRCESCKITLKNNFTLERHNEMVHKIEKFKSKACPIESCKFKANSESDIKGHITRKHSSKEKIKCQLCELEFPSDSGLKKHRLTMHRVFCVDCSQTFCNEKTFLE